MIKHTELRPGNLVLTEDGTPVPIQAAGILAIDQGRLKVYPIPITTEWLENKFGFQYQCGSWEKGFRLDEVWNDFKSKTEYRIDIEGYPTWQPIEISYIHQLQNLYFFLTGEELTIKEH